MGPQEISLLSRVCAAPMTVSGHPRHFERAPALPVYSQHRKYRCVAAAPWQELSDVCAALVGCGLVSGQLMRRGWPLDLMLCADRVPIVCAHSEVALTQAGSRDPRNNRIPALRRHALANSLHPRSTLDYAACESDLGSFIRSPCTIMARGRQRHSGDSGVAWTRQARDDGSLHPRGDRNNRQDREPARTPERAAPQARKARH